MEYIPLAQNDIQEADFDPKQCSERKALGILAPVVSIIGPHVSAFMSKMIGNLISGVAARPKTDIYKDNVIKRFTQRVFKGTTYDKSKAIQVFSHNINDRNYQVALANMASHEIPMNIDTLYPNEQSLGRVKDSVFHAMTKAMNTMLSQRLLEASSVQVRFLSAVTDENRRILQGQHEQQKFRDQNLEEQGVKITDMLTQKLHSMELQTVYILLGLALFLQILAIFFISVLRNRLLYWLLKHQAEQTPSYLPLREPSHLSVQPCCPPTLPSTNHTPLVDRTRLQSFKDEGGLVSNPSSSYHGHELAPLVRGDLCGQSPPVDRKQKKKADGISSV